MTRTPRSTRRVLVAFTAVLASLAATAVALTGSSGPVSAVPARANLGRHYAVNRPLCARPASPTAFRCFAMRRVDVEKGTTGAYSYVRPDAIERGPAGGFTPADIATAYGFDPRLKRPHQLVAIVDWYDNPHALRDLNAFDAHYGFARETSTSFRKVNQNGRTSPLPIADRYSAGEIALDIQIVRAVCRTCRILLVEANGPTDSSIAVAENRAAAMGATEISNSFGAPERPLPASVTNAFNHPGVVITASTGDDGWYGFDWGNDFRDYSDEAPSFPATFPTVVAVGGTSLTLNNDRTRATETVWNGNGVDNANGRARNQGLGASGGGCSTRYAARSFQTALPNYVAAGCKGRRLAADVAALADPRTGFDVLDSFGSGGWITVGGTSLSAPLTAALFALAGGSYGSAYPAASIYANARLHPSSRYDVTKGGTGYCSDPSTRHCADAVFAASGRHNPNNLGGGLSDCSFPRYGSEYVPTTVNRECNAASGFDGPSGVGTPKRTSTASGLRLYWHTNPSVTITHASSLRHGRSAAFTGHSIEASRSIHPIRYTWYWGDGRSTVVASRWANSTTHHIWSRAGTHLVTLWTTDSYGQVVRRRTTVTVS